MNFRTDFTTAQPDWAARIVTGQSIVPVLPLDEARAEKALRIFKRLKLVDVPGKPSLGEACGQWVFDFVRVVFGARDEDTRRQLIREFFVLVSKKNSKSSIAAGIMLTALIMNERAQGEYLILAPTKDVADNSFTPAYGMVKADQALFARYKPSDTTREIVDRLNGSVLAVKSADADVVGGQKAIAIFVDELWLFGKRASAENILSEATGSLAARPEGFVIYASTQSDDPPAGVFRKKLQYHRGVRDGRIKDRTSLPLIYEYPVEMQKAQAWRDPSTWKIPNPSLGRSVDPEWLASELTKKETDGPDSLRLFVAKHFNVEVGVGLHSDAWPGAEHWEKNADPTITLESIIERCETVVAGIDGGGLDDLLGLIVMGREKTTRNWLAWARAWAHRSVFKRKDIVSTLEGFVTDGDLVLVENLEAATQELADIVERLDDAGLLPRAEGKPAIGVDQLGMPGLIDGLCARGFSEDRIGGVAQSFKLSGAIHEAGVRLRDARLKHAGQRLMAWNVGNAKVEPRGNAITITKQSAGSAKIDCLMALFDAVVVMGLNPEPPRAGWSTDNLDELMAKIDAAATASAPRDPTS